MNRVVILTAVLIATGSVLGGCAGSGEGRGDSYRPVGLGAWTDPLAPRKEVLPWTPPRQMAAWVHPHEDRRQGILIGGHWIFIVLGDGSWYFEDARPKEPVPDAELSPEDLTRALRALDVPRGAVIPYAPRREEGK